jgi:hypothetical protein
MTKRGNGEGDRRIGRAKSRANGDGDVYPRKNRAYFLYHAGLPAQAVVCGCAGLR